ncbi:MAG: hypothetical protein WC331_10510 [Candidatus Omnitrophota bacterium]|jgi:hypothetical protein
MTGSEIAAVAALLELTLKYGVPAAVEMIKTLQTDNPTAEDIRALAPRVPHPDTYEKGGV